MPRRVKPEPIGNINACSSALLQVRSGGAYRTLATVPNTPRCIGEAMAQLGRRSVFVLAWGERRLVGIAEYQNFIDHPLPGGPLAPVAKAGR